MKVREFVCFVAGTLFGATLIAYALATTIVFKNKAEEIEEEDSCKRNETTEAKTTTDFSISARPRPT